MIYQHDVVVYNVCLVVPWYVICGGVWFIVVVQGYMLMWCLPGQYLLPPLSTSQTLPV